MRSRMHGEKERAPKVGSLPKGCLDPVGHEARPVLSNLFDGHEVTILMPKNVKNQDMECGGRIALHRHLSKEAPIKDLSALCGQCAVENVCMLRA